MALRVATASTIVCGHRVSHMAAYTTRLLTLWLEKKDVFDHRFVRGVWGPFIRQDPCHACLTGRVDELHFGLFWGVATQGDDQRILASECLTECFRLGVIDLLGNHAFWKLVLAIDPRDCRNGVLAGLEQGFSHGAAAVATSLRLSVDDLQAKQ